MGSGYDDIDVLAAKKYNITVSGPELLLSALLIKLGYKYTWSGG